MTRAQETLAQAIMMSFKGCTIDEDFMIQISVDTNSGPFLFSIDDDCVSVVNEENNVNRSYKFVPFLQYLKGFSERFDIETHKLKPTRGVDMTALEVNLTHNEELFLSEVALVARTAKTDLVHGSDAVSFNDCQVRGLLTTLTTKRVFSKSPSASGGMQYYLTSTGFRVLGYESPVRRPQPVKRSVDGKPAKTIAEEFGNINRSETKSGKINPRTEYSLGRPPRTQVYNDEIEKLRGPDNKKQPLCRKLILLGFDNDTITKAIKELIEIDYPSAEVNKQRRSLNRKTQN